MKALVMLAACAACSLGGKRPTYQYYVLTSTPARAAPESEQARGLAIDQVTIPGYLDREQIATRTGGHRLTYSTTDRWAEPLDQAFERALREDLAAKLADTGIDVQARGGTPAYELRVDVERFEQSGTGQVELQARWTLRSRSAVIDTGKTSVRVPMAGADSDAMASALSEAVARMATELAGRVHEADLVATRS